MKPTLRGFAGVPPAGAPVAIDFEGTPVPAHAGEPVAAALFAAGIRTLGRSPKYHRPRGLFCLDGHCASCSMRIDGRPNRRACMVPARDGLTCERQNAFPSADVDVLAAADWLFPRGMDHHTLMTSSRAGNAMFLKMVREMGGSGTLPATDAPATVTTDEIVDACVIGGGPAGLGAAREIARAAPGARVVVYDEQTAPGGSLHAESGGTRPRARRWRTRRGPRARAWSRTRRPSASFPRTSAPTASPACWRWRPTPAWCACARSARSTRRAPTIRTCRSATTIARG